VTDAFLKINFTLLSVLFF